ncbi:putative Leucine-rich repeat family protein [Hibiscus syriacus]|uniref:Leucine-rich repeat family protein n=1 Tax=Hibiscus syriacus TaxID=106335 RepID=A0A6A3AFX3_HIBSY|nr:putative Leucine-rich repeat family protein [Hibiscus syriacus]
MAELFISILSRLQKAWNAWNIRGAILFSLLLQVVLIFVAPVRKSARKKVAILLIWIAYLLADAAANFAVGLISNSQRGQSDSDKSEDPSLPNDKLMIPTILMFCAGIIKYVERTVALYLASLDTFRDSMLKDPDAGPNYAKLMEEYAYKREAELPTRIDLTPEPDKETKASDIPPKEGELNHLEVVHYGFYYFQKFKGLIVDIIFSFRERDESRDFFYRRTAEDALRVIEVELNFIYRTLYTKLEVVYSWPGSIFRFLAFGSTLATLGIFHFKTNKDAYDGVEIGITYTLLLGAIVLDVIAIFTMIFSDRTFTFIKNPDRPTHGICASVFSIFLALKKPRWHRCKCPVAEEHRHHLLATCFAFRRWSGSISSHNLISWFEDTLDEFFYVSLEPITKELWEFIFSELKKKAEFADNPETAKRISSARGEWALTDTDSEHDRSKILRYVSDVPYDESILLWHIATDLCYQTEKEETESKNGGENLKYMHFSENLKYMHFSKILSDYMLYLLIFQPTMMSAVAGIAKIRFRDTCAEARIFFERRNLRRNEDKEACHQILSVNTDVEPEQVKGDRSKSVFFSASILAKELKRMEDEDKEKKWIIMSRVWVELVSYAASHCRANTHAAEVSKGGQLISFFWLLMVHFGLGEQFQINEGHARAKLIIEK